MVSPIINAWSTAIPNDKITIPAEIVYTTTELSNSSLEETVKQYCDKVDRHVDKLEEDIEFLNNERISHDDLIGILVHENIEKNNKIKDLTDTIESLKRYIDDRLNTLEKKLNENNS